MDERKISLNILGCCVLRDTFGMHSDNGGYAVNRYVQIPSPISLVTGSPLFRKDAEIEDTVFEGKSGFVKRCQILELKKQVFDYLGGVSSDYLILDCAEARKNVLYFPDTEGWFTESHKDLLARFIEQGLLPERYEVIDVLEMERGALYAYLREFCDRLLEQYDKNRMILFEIEAVKFHSDGKQFQVFGGKNKIAEQFNARMKLCFDYVKTYLEGCHIVEFPDNVIGDTNHKWGRALLHYVPEYYDYAQDAVDIITKHAGSLEEEKEELSLLKHDYEAVLRKKYGDILQASMEQAELERRSGERILKYEQYFRRLLIEDGKEKIRAYLVGLDIRSCALYGRTQITYVFLPWFRSWGIHIEYVVENYSVNPVWEGVPFIKRNDLSLLDSRNMIICDIRYEAIEKRLAALGYTGTVINYSELISPPLRLPK